MDGFNGMPEDLIHDKAMKCMTDAKCDCPAFTAGMHSLDTKLEAAVRNDDQLMRDGGKVVGDRLRNAIASHNQRWQTI